MGKDACTYCTAGGGDNDSLWSAREGELFIKAPGDEFELVLKDTDNFKRKDPSFGGIAFGALMVVNIKSEQRTRVVTTGELADNYCDFALCGKSPFLLQKNLSVAFYWQHQNSTDSDRLGVIDLKAGHSQFVSENPAFAVRHGTRSGFFCVCWHRYQPLGNTGHTVNCLYLDWWDEKLHQTRFASAISLFGGASVRVKGQPQLNISPDEHE